MSFVSNLIVRVGADMSGLTSGLNKGGKSTKAFKARAAEEFKSLSQSVAKMESAYQSLTEATARVNLGTSVSKQIKALEKDREKLQDQAEKTASSIAYWSEVEPLGAQWNTVQACAELDQLDIKIQNVTAQIKELQDISALGRDAGLSDVSARSLDGLQDRILKSKDRLDRLSDAAKSSGSWLKRVASGLLHIGTSSKRSGRGVEGLLRSIRRLGIVSLGLRFIRAIFGELGSVVHQYISENAALQAQVNGLKSAFGQALAPAINVVTNALAALMPYVVGVSNAIGSLISNLFGSGWTTVADGANAAAKAIGGAGGAQKEFNRSLQGFDEITKLDSKSSGGGGGGSAESTTTPVEGKLPAWMTGLTDRIEEAVRADDWFGVGSAIADSLNKALDGQSDTGPTIGGKIAGWINSAIDSVVGFIETVEWSNLGSSLKRNISDLVDGINWGDIFGLLGSASGGIASALGSMFNDAILAVSKHFEESISEAESMGMDIMAGIGMGIGKALANAGLWIKEKIFTPFIDGCKSTFKIHSPSTHPEITGIGKNVMLGILNGVLEPLKNPVAWIREHIFTPLVEGIESVFGTDSAVGQHISKWLLGDSNLNTNAEVDVQANLTTYKDKLRNKAVPFRADFTSWKDNLVNKYIGVRADFTSWKDNLANKHIGVRADFTTWKDQLSGKVVDFQSRLTTWKDSLSDKWLTFSANVQKGWSGTLASYLGISEITTKLKIKAPEVYVSWTTESSPSGTTKVDSPEFTMKYNARGAIFNAASLLGRVGNDWQVAGEAGREALLPLDRHTWWMDDISDRTASKVSRIVGGGEQAITVNLIVDGKVLASTVVRNVNAQARATGKNPLAAYM